MRAALAAFAMAFGLAGSATAGDYNGNFMVRVLGAGVFSQDELTSLNSVSGLPVADLKAAGFDAEVSDRFIPAATLTYFLTKNLSVELFCCFTHHHIDLKAPAAFAALSGKVAESWMFPPALTLQYHFDGMGPFKPYVGVGAQYIHFFSEKTGANTLAATSVDIDDAFGVTIQAGFDVAIGNGWYLNADVKKTWLDTTVTWRNSAVTGGNIVAKADIDPLIVSAGIGYRFNLDDIFGRRDSHDSLK
ncbi:MAG: OmpW family outer membrane protein [Hyphomicrobiaceae bacterium]|nr:OmpW family outer membrane protein [Hyphomicrobiaceae bacterium]